MNKKNILVLIFLVFSAIATFGQEKDAVLSAPDNWRGEIIPFPLEFAPSMDFVGVEDLRFSPGWADANSQEFWAFSFAWHIEKKSDMTESRLTESFKLYYDGLMGIDEQNQTDSLNSKPLEQTICLFIKTDDGFIGKMRVFDMFFTKDYITLNIKVKEYFCPITNSQIFLCNLSPKKFDHDVWAIFEDVTVMVECE